MKTIEVKKKKIIIEQNVAKIYPNLENLTITPSREQQIFNHPNSYGYDEVVVEATKINLQDKFVTPSGKIQEVVADENYDGLSKVTVDKVSSEVLSVAPTSESQSFSGLYSEVNVAGDSDLLPENIKKGVNIFGVDGEASVADFEINDCSYLFYYGARVNAIDGLLPLCKNTVSTREMFYQCSSLTSLDLSSFDTSKVTNMYSMFGYCKSLTSLDLSSFNTSNVTNMGSMFNYSNKLASIDLSSFDTSNVTNMSNMFIWCSALKNLDIRNFTFDKVTSYSDMFYRVPTDCLIIVKGDTEKEWITSKFTTLTNVKTVAEL